MNVKNVRPVTATSVATNAVPTVDPRNASPQANVGNNEYENSIHPVSMEHSDSLCPSCIFRRREELPIR